MPPVSRRWAFSLVELLVVLVVLAILLGLLLPAIQRAREAGNRTRCQNNLKQLGLALHAYQTTLGSFPQAYNEFWNFCEPADAPQSPDPRPRKSWAGLVLPFVEQELLASSGALNAQQALLLIYQCPSDPRWGGLSYGGNYKFLGDQFGLTSYLAVEGSAYRLGSTVATEVAMEFGGPKDGVIYRSSDTHLTDITDGSSNTLLVGERPPSPAPALDWGWWAWSAYDSALAVVDRRLLIYSDCPSPSVYGPGDPENECDATHFWSFHPGGANWLFADGSVRFLPYSARDLLPALATRSGGETVDPSEY
jgi:prepilin-type processing-associated H-X9-DG protein